MAAEKLRLYHYWRSSSSWRVRWALAHKGVGCEFIHINLLTGESESPEHLARNPLGYVPVLELGSRRIFESMAILEWLEETHPAPALLPRDPYDRARVRQLCEIINSDTAPLQNLNPQILHSDDPGKRKAWAQHWIRNGLNAYETIARETAGRFSLGDALSFADLLLVPQCYNAARYEVPLDPYPTVKRVFDAALATPSAQASHPDRFKPAGA